MPVVIPADLAEEGMRMAWYAAVDEGVLHKGPPSTYVSSHISDWSINVRLFTYCCSFTDEDFATHVHALMKGETSVLPGSRRAAACRMELVEAEAMGVPMGFSCFRCGKVSPVIIPSALRKEWTNDRLRRSQHFKACSKCMFAHYCDRHCQKADWGRHKEVCSTVSRALQYDDRRKTQKDANVKISFGFATPYEFCLWAHIVGRQNPSPPDSYIAQTAVAPTTVADHLRATVDRDVVACLGWR